jgi:hypothetical protein
VITAAQMLKRSAVLLKFKIDNPKSNMVLQKDLQINPTANKATPVQILHK